jgi:hypothetical protein
MHKDRPVRIIHFGLKMRESDPVKLIAKAVIPSGNMCTADDMTDHSNTFCHRVVKIVNTVLHHRYGKSETEKRMEKL